MSDEQNTGTGGTSQGAANEIPVAEERAPGYFPTASEVCPRCHAQDYLPVRDDEGRDLRECLSCHLVYLSGENSGGTGDNPGGSGQ